MTDLSGRDFLKLLDFSESEIRFLLDSAKKFKQMKKTGHLHEYLKGKTIALIFEKDSTRTRCAFEVAAYDLGMNTTYLGPTGSQMGKKETIADTARVLSRMYDGIEYRGFDQSIVEDLAHHSSVPVWNGLTNEFHPTQILADMLTIEEHLGKVKGKSLVYLGDARFNMANSLMIGCAKMGMHFTAVAPKSLWPEADLVKQAKEIAKKNEGSVTLTEDVMEGTKHKDIVYTDVWLSMGEDQSQWAGRIKMLKDYQVTKKVMENAGEESLFMHALPSFHNLGTEVAKEIHEKFGVKEMEVTDDVFESKRSVIFDQAENRMHTIKAVIYETLKS